VTGRPLPRGWCVYLLRCRDGSLYGGATNDLARRLAVHARGAGARYTRSRLPVELAWCARAAGRSAALRREAAVKRLTRSEKLDLIGERRGSRMRLPRSERGARGGASSARRRRGGASGPPP